MAAASSVLEDWKNASLIAREPCTFSSKGERLQTFLENWSWGGDKSRDLAAQGFYWKSNENKVVCDYCKLKVDFSQNRSCMNIHGNHSCIYNACMRCNMSARHEVTFCNDCDSQMILIRHLECNHIIQICPQYFIDRLFHFNQRDHTKEIVVDVDLYMGIKWRSSQRISTAINCPQCEQNVNSIRRI